MTKKQSKLTSFFTAVASPNVKSSSASKREKEVEEPAVVSPPGDSPKSEASSSAQSPPVPLHTQLRKLEVDTEDLAHRGRNAKYLYGFVTAWDAASGTYSVDFMDSADINTKVGEETGLTLDQVKHMLYLNSVIGSYVRKDFDQGPFEGVVVDVDEDHAGDTLYVVVYEDDEAEDLDEQEFQDCRAYYNEYHMKKSPSKSITNIATRKTKDVTPMGKRGRRKPVNYAESEEDSDDDDDEDFKKPPAKKKRVLKKRSIQESSDEEMEFKPPDSEDESGHGGDDFDDMSDGDDAGNADDMPEDKNHDGDDEGNGQEEAGSDEGSVIRVDGQYRHYDNEFHKKLAKDVAGFSAKSNPQPVPDLPYVDPVGIDPTHGIVEGIVSAQVRKVAGLLKMVTTQSISDSAGELCYPIRLQTACSGTDAPSIALGLVKESLDRMMTDGHAFAYSHEMSCEIEPFKQAYIGRNFPGVPLFPDITKLTASEEVLDVYGRPQKLPDGNLFVAGTSCKDFSMLKTRYRLDIEDKGTSGETFLAAVEFLQVKQPAVAIFENVINAPWAKMQEYITGRLELCNRNNTKGITNGKGAKKAEQSLKFSINKDGRYVAEEIPRQVGMRAGDIVQGFVRKGDNAANVQPLVSKPGSKGSVTLGELAKKHGISLKDDILVMEKKVRYCTHLVKVDTKDFGLPQTRQRQYLFIWKSDDPDDNLGAYFQSILEHLQTPLLHSMDAFLLPDTHDRIRCFREALRSGPGLMVKRERAKEPDFWDWNLSRVKDLTLHIAYRQNTGIGERNRWLTGWNTRGRKQLAPGLWPELFDCWNHRRLDMVDCFGISAIHDGVSRDPLHHSFTWDVSQNVTRAPYRNATCGVSGCVTPGGELLLPHRGRTVMGYEKLLLQGIPFSRLLLGPETEVQLSDLAGNAMSVPVVCAVQLAAICAPHLRREHMRAQDKQKKSSDKKKQKKPVKNSEVKDLLISQELSEKYDHAGGTVLAERGDLYNMPRSDTVQNLLDFLRDDKLASDAYLSSVLCTCESSGTMTKSPAILQCTMCGHSVCHICSSRYNLANHSLEQLSLPTGSRERPDPHVFERLLRCALPSVLRLGPNWEEILNNGQGLESYSFQLQEVQRKMGHWQLLFGAWEDHGKGRQVAEIRIHIGQTSTLSSQRGAAVFIRRFAPAIRHKNPFRGPLKDSARLMLTSKSEPQWEIREIWNSKTNTPVELKLVGSNMCPSQRVLAGINDSAARRLKQYKANRTTSLPDSRNPLTHYHSLWKKWPGTIVVSGDPTDRVNGIYQKMKCTHTVVLSALWRRDDCGMYLYFRPDVLRTKLDVAVFSPSPSYKDGREICELIDWIPENTLEEKRQTTKAKFLEWKQAPSNMIVEAMQPRMVFQPSATPFHQRVIASKAPELDSAVLCKLTGLLPPTIDALLEYSRKINGKDLVHLDLFGKSGTRNAKRLSIVVTPSLLKYAAEGKLSLTLSEWYRLPESIPFGKCVINVPPRPVEHWRLRTDSDGKPKPERFYDPEESNEYYQRLFNRPNGFTVAIDRGNHSLVIHMNPHVAAHRAAAQLGGNLASPLSVDYCLAELSSMGEPPTRPFHVPNSDAYDPSEIDGLTLPLYTRQAKALTRMLSVERGDVPFSEEERSEIVLPGVGWCLIARASRKSRLRGGVLGDAIGSGKTVVTIALILAGVTRARANRDAANGRSGATLIVVPPGLVRQWDDERKKFTGNALKCVIIDSTATLKKYSVEDLCKADIVIVPAGLIEEGSGQYTQMLSRKAEAGAIPLAPANYSQREAPTIEGTWVRNMASGPEIYVGNKGKQKYRDEQAYYGHCYGQAIEKLRTKNFAVHEKGVPIEYFTWERLVIDECHETLVTGKSQECDDDRFKPRARRGAREFLGVAVTDIEKRPLRAATGVWGLTGTPLLETEARVTELANLMGGTYLTGAAHHWRKEERESGRDLFLNQQGASRSREYRCAVQAACHSYVKEACQRNRGEKLNVELTRVLSEVRMGENEAKKFFEMTSDLASQSFNISPDQLGEKAGDVLSLTAASPARHAALLETIDSILHVDPATKIIVFSNTTYGGYDSAVKALTASGRPFCRVSDSDSVEAQNETLSWFRHEDVTDEERVRPRVLLLSFEQAAGHNLQEACHNVILYDPFYSGSDAVADASVEEQAVGRVMRQGQKYDVTVTRIVVRGPQGERSLDDWIVERNLDRDVLDAATSNFD